MSTQSLTSSDAKKLDGLRRKCEVIQSDPFLVKHTNVDQVYQAIMDTISFHTDKSMDEIYTIPGISKPAS